MTYRQVRECVYWLPNMDDIELSWALYEGFEHRLAHRFCWKKLSEKRKDQYRSWCFEGQEPRSMGQRV